MRSADFWTSHYVTSAEPAGVVRAADTLTVTSGRETVELLLFPHGQDVPSILVSPGSGGHAYVFAELAYLIHRAGYRVFVMPKHGGRTIDDLVVLHRNVIRHIAARYGDNVGVYGEGLGGYVAFYLALARTPFVRSIACQNSPAILTDPAYHRALLAERGPWTKAVRRRRLMLPIGRWLVRGAPWLRVPISSYLPWQDLIDTHEGVREVERRLVLDGYLKDPDFDRWYPLSAVMSLVSTPPPAPLPSLTTPTMFVVASQGPTPGYIADLYDRLPVIPKRIMHVQGSVYWMLSHPRQAAAVICDWFGASLSHQGACRGREPQEPTQSDPQPTRTTTISVRKRTQRMHLVSPFTDNNLNGQGFGYLDQEAKSRYALPLRFTPAVGTTLIVVGLVMQSPIWLGVAALIALSGALFPKGMVIDLVYNLGVRHLFRAPPLPPTPRPRRFSYVLSASLLAGAAVSFLYRRPALGFVLAGLVVLGGAILTTTLWCLGSWIYRVLVGPQVRDRSAARPR